MRKQLAVMALLLLSALPAIAQQTNGTSGPFRVTVFASDLGYTESDRSGSNFTGGIGAALEYQWRERWSAELSYATEERRARGFTTITERDGTVLHDFHPQEVRSHPIDLVARYRFGVASRWKPYVGLGVRYVDNESTQVEVFQQRTSAQVTGGVDFQITPRLSLRFDGKRLLRGDSALNDPVDKFSVGMGWSF